MADILYFEKGMNRKKMKLLEKDMLNDDYIQLCGTLRRVNHPATIDMLEDLINEIVYLWRE